MFIDLFQLVLGAISKQVGYNFMNRLITFYVCMIANGIKGLNYSRQ
jgi:hypothetical protein